MVKLRNLRFFILSALLFVALLFPLVSFAQLIHQFKYKDTQLLFFNKELSQHVPYIMQTYYDGKARHDQLWNAAPYDSLSIYKQGKTVIYFTDWEDDGNAGASSLPFVMIAVGIAPLNFSYYVYPSVERFYHLFNHEQTHVVMADKYTKSDYKWRKFLGAKVSTDAKYPVTAFWSYLSNPRWYVPRWYHEGIACYLETWMNGGVGRALGGYDEMYFRSIVEGNDKIFSVIGLVTEGTTSDFQAGTNSYLYGTRFVNYLSYKYGVDSLFNFYNRTADSKRAIGKQFKKVYGESLKKSWNEWREFEVENQKEIVKKIGEYPITPTKGITDKPLGSASPPLYDEERGVIYMAVNYPNKFAHLLEVDLKTGKEKELCKITGPMIYQTAYLAFDKKNDRLFFTTYNSKIRGLNVYDIKKKRITKRIKYTRMSEIAYDNVRNRLYGVQSNGGVASIVYYDEELKNVSRIYTLPFGQSITDIAVSNSGKYLVGTINGQQGEQTLVKFDVDNLENAKFEYEKILTLHDSNLSQFKYAQNDSLLIGSSYYTGVSNIWAIDLETKELELLSNVETGLFAPLQILPDSLIALRFERNGMKPVKMGINSVKSVNAIEYLGQKAFERNPMLEKLDEIRNENKVDLSFKEVYDGITTYNFLKELKFAGAYPDISGYKDCKAFNGVTPVLGYRFRFEDNTGINKMDFFVGVSPWSNNAWKERFHFNFNWTVWNWTLDTYYNNTNFYDLFGPLRSSRAGYKVGLAYNYVNSLLTPFSWKWGADVSTYGMMDALPMFQNISTEGVTEMQTASAYIEASDMRTSLGGVTPEAGYKVGLTAQTYFARIDSDNDGQKSGQLFPSVVLNMDGGMKLPFMRNSSFWIRSAVGQSFGDKESPFGNNYFGGFRNNYVDYREARRYRSVNSMAGAGIDEIAAHSFAKAMGEINLPPVRFNNLGFLGFYPTYAQMSVFTTDLIANPWGNGKLQNYVNVGTQLDVELVFFTYLKVMLSAGYARLYYPKGSYQEGSKEEWMFSVKLL